MLDPVSQLLRMLWEHLSGQNHTGLIPAFQNRLELFALDNSLIERSKHLIENKKVTFPRRQNFLCIVQTISDVDALLTLLFLTQMFKIAVRFLEAENLNSGSRRSRTSVLSNF